jgi:hypothetical protein
MTRFHVFFGLLFLIVGILLVAGCLYEDYVPKHDVILIKVTPTGTLEWSKIFDSGKDDRSQSFFQTSDGGYAMLGEIEDKHHLGWYHNNLIKFSDIGDEEWNRTLYQLHCGEEFLTRDSDGLLLTYVSSPELGEICKFNLQGDLVWNGTTVIIGNKSMNGSELSNATNGHFESVRLDEKGNITKMQTLINATAHCIPAVDGGYFCAGLQSDEGEKRINPFEGAKTKIMAKKMDAEGILMWEQPVIAFCRPKYRDNIELTGIIQTSDKGYLIISSRDNAYKC